MTDSGKLRERWHRLKARRDALEAAGDAAARELASATSNLEAAASARDVFLKAGDACLDGFRGGAASLASSALSGVFGDGWSLRLEMSPRGKECVSQEAELVVVGPDGRETDPMDANGGGLKDMASWALRLAMLSAWRPSPRRTLVLDEPFRDLSPDLRPLGAGMLREAADGMGLQIVMTTNEREYMDIADLVVEMPCP